MSMGDLILNTMAWQVIKPTLWEGIPVFVRHMNPKVVSALWTLSTSSWKLAESGLVRFKPYAEKAITGTDSAIHAVKRWPWYSKFSARRAIFEASVQDKEVYIYTAFDDVRCEENMARPIIFSAQQSNYF